MVGAPGAAMVGAPGAAEEVEEMVRSLHHSLPLF